MLFRSVIDAPVIVVKEGKKPYKMATLAYRDDEGKVQEKKIMSFVNPEVFKVVEALHRGDIIYVEATKNDQGYWQWDSVTIDSGSPIAASTDKPRADNAKASWQSEQAERQKHIARSVALNAAVEASTRIEEINEVLEIAEKFEAWLNRE